MKSLKIVILSVIIPALRAFAEVPVISESASPDEKYHAVMDIDRDPTIEPEWKGDSYPKIEITEKETGKILQSIEYFGATGDDQRPLREHVSIRWRGDSGAFTVTINDRFYSNTSVFIYDGESKFVSIGFPIYEELTGRAAPAPEDLRPRGRSMVEGWGEKGELVYQIYLSPEASYTGDDPMHYRVRLDIRPNGMVVLESTPILPDEK